MLPEKSSELDDVISSYLRLRYKPEFLIEPDLGLGVRPDLVLDGDDGKVVVEVANRASAEELAHLALFQRALGENARFVLAAKVVPQNIMDIAERIGMETIVLPQYLTIPHGTKGPQGTLTSEKAWRVSSRLLRERRCSIRHIALSEGVSYGWAHRTVKRLISRGIVVQRGHIVELADANRLLDAVAWERPFDDLRIVEHPSPSKDPFDVAREISSMSFDDDAKVPFTAFTSATLFVGHGTRHDAIYCYANSRPQADGIARDLGTGDGIRVVFHRPDRDVLSQAKDVDGILVTSPSQTLLDLAGFGYQGRDLARRMVERYANL
ncbi:MAG: hypothetical protein L0Z54_02745 [Thermoplasmata archaeon]|nr:hypothetical protein [Thermoplasmata archaeon]